MKKHPIASAMRDLLGTRPLVGLTRVGVDVQQRRRYGRIPSEAEVSPWRIIWIDPRSVRGVPRARSSVYPQSDRIVSHVIDGDWDLERRDFWGSEVARAIRGRIVDGADWEDTDLVIRLTRELSVPGVRAQWHGCRTPSDVLARCARIDRLIDDIGTHGYRTPSGIRPGESGLTRDYPPDAVSIGVGRDGELMHLNGKHRLAIAMSLRLDSIPVRIGVRHASWQSLRDDHLRGAGPLMDHPDIAFLLDGSRPPRPSAGE